MAGPGEAVRDFNRDRLLAAVRGGVESRAELCSVTGLARSTVTGLVRELLASGDLVERSAEPAEPGDRPRGRPVGRLSVPARRHVVLAVDYGHSHCEVALLAVTGADVVVLARETASLDVDSSPDDALDRAEDLARRLLAAHPADPPVAGGIGLPAPVDVATGAVGAGNLLQRWVDLRPAEELAARLGVPFVADNDANLGALAEATFGEGRGATELIYVKAASGIGAGLLLGGRIHHGRGGRAGEIGHVPVDARGALCRCGNRGCLETLASVPQVLAAFGDRPDGPRDAAEVVRLVEAGDVGAIRVVGDAGRLIGRTLADLVNVLNPEHVVVGGPLAAAGDALVAGIRESVERYAQPELARELLVSASRLTESAELLGAAALAVRQASGQAESESA